MSSEVLIDEWFEKDEVYFSINVSVQYLDIVV
jgi:hypothetical protein